jgi:hypothetical protein
MAVKNAISQVKVDIQATYQALVLVNCQPKLMFGSDQQEYTKGDNPLPKWTVELLGAAYDGRGGTESVVLTVGMTSRENPAKHLTPFAPVFPAGLTVGFMAKTSRTQDGGEKMTGTTVWMRCDELQRAVVESETAAA